MFRRLLASVICLILLSSIPLSIHRTDVDSRGGFMIVISDAMAFQDCDAYDNWWFQQFCYFMENAWNCIVHADCDWDNNDDW